MEKRVNQKIFEHQLNEYQISLYYFQVTDLWKKLCETHTQLFDLTCDEYYFLLNSELEKLEEKICEKEEVIQTIHKLEQIRKEIINELNQHIITPIDNVQDLVTFMSQLLIEKKERHLFRFNALLIDIIEKVQQQNKKNQLFINKALISLKQIRMDVMGKKNYTTYSSKGAAINIHTSR